MLEVALSLLLAALPAASLEEVRALGDSLAAAEALAPLLAAELERLGSDRPAPEWLELAQRAVAIREREQGPQHPDLAQALIALGRLTDRSERPSEAVTHLERALAIQAQALGPDDLALASTLEYLGRSLREAGRLEDALARFERSLEIRERQLGAGSLEATHSLNALANLTAQMGRYEISRAYFERLIAAREALLGPDDIEVAYALGNFAVLYGRQDDHAAAIPLLRRSLAIVETVRGPMHPEVANGLNNLGILLMKTGDYAGAQECMERSLRIREQAHGPEHLQTVAARLQLATLLRELGDYEAARPMYERALAHWEHAEESHPSRADGQNNYAVLLAEMGDRAEARRLYEAALKVKEQVYGPQHRSVAHTLNNLGALLLDDGDPHGARPLLERALAIKQQQLGAEHVSTAATLVPLGQVLAALGEPTAGRDRLQQALAIQEQALGPDHPSVATTLTALGGLLHSREMLERARRIRVDALGPDHPLVAQSLELLAARALEAGDRVTALEAGLDAERVGREHVRITARTLAEREAMGYASVRGSGLDTALSVATTPEAVERVWDSAIRSRALVLDEMLLRQRALHGNGDPELERPARELQAARDRLARIAVRGPAGDDVAGYRRLLDWSRREKEEAERALAQRSVAYRSDAPAAGPGLAEVRRALGRRTALVAYLRYEDGAAGFPAYVAFVLPSPESRPLLVRLGRAADIESAIQAWREQAAMRPPAMQHLRRQAEERCRAAGQRLRELAWDGVAQQLHDSDRALVVPDQALSLVPLAALPVPTGDGYLVESGLELHYVAAERDLLLDARAGRSSGLLLVGAPDFGSGPPLRFAPLPATEAEIDDIAALWSRDGRNGRVEQRRGRAADEASVKSLVAQRRVLHLATHAFAEAGDVPLAATGLAFAGANDGAPAGGREDGVLTAEEIGSLDLSGTEWVVLSACDTGLGLLHPGEGILGLRRAFQVAGARTLITALWSVQDEATRAFMAELYRGRLAGASTAKAVQQAGVHVLASRRDAGLSTHPFYWGAFIASGDWR